MRCRSKNHGYQWKIPVAGNGKCNSRNQDEEGGQILLDIHQFPYGDDNYGVLLHCQNSGETAMVDAGDAEAGEQARQNRLVAQPNLDYPSS